MNGNVIITASALLCTLPAMLTLADETVDSASPEDAAAVRIEITDTRVTGDILEIEYEIINDSDDDAWIYAALTASRNTRMDYSVFSPPVNATLLFDKDDGIPTISGRIGWLPHFAYPHTARYVRMRSGESQTEWITIEMHSLSRSRGEILREQDQVVSLAIEFGYYVANPAEEVFRIHREQEEMRYREGIESLDDKDYYYGLLGITEWNSWNNGLISRDEEFMVMQPGVEGQQFVRAVVNDLGNSDLTEADEANRFSAEYLTSCARVEIQFQPSTLEYFFPYDFQHSLLTPEEMKQFTSKAPLVVGDSIKAKIAADRARRGTSLRCRSRLSVICLADDGHAGPFSVYWQRARLLDYHEFSSLLPMSGKRIHAIDLRTHCAAHLRDVWYCIRFYGMAAATRSQEASINSLADYPPSLKWCDAMMLPVRPVMGTTKRRVLTYIGNDLMYVCPSAPAGKCHYAMNPNCKPDSPSDMVLLFETNAGWNQHGGPEIFTFDNHDPKGGCVLLNDGTVKFIRTKEQLGQLRWQ
ncbi:MAG: hypothetical protein ACYS7Y_34785 [Planctomycetota bacterium]|jgi:hypothetical protein